MTDKLMMLELDESTVYQKFTFRREEKGGRGPLYIALAEACFSEEVFFRRLELENGCWMLKGLDDDGEFDQAWELYQAVLKANPDCGGEHYRLFPAPGGWQVEAAPTLDLRRPARKRLLRLLFLLLLLAAGLVLGWAACLFRLGLL